jgi:hypothetical protein
MTNRTACEFLDIVLLDKFCSERDLIRRRLPLHAEDLLTRPHKTLRITVALQAPFHVERVLAPHERHLIDSPMTGNAAYSFVNVDAVIEISKSGHIVDPYPFDGLARSVTFPHRRKQRTVRPDLGMAIHADFRRRNAGKSRVFYRGVTVSTVDPVVTDVVLVTELNRLRARHTDSSHIGRSVNGSHERQEQYNYGNAAEDADPGNRVCASVKYLGHRPRNSPGVVFSGSGPVINRACRRTSSASIGPTTGSSATQS